ncbi:hypothetical protein B0H10DRAFT_1940819 [Mycena sp. CBHHK59/15]|nr:hypothetical protein B0H10DRAFT_1940819 [Mycena sp. CBHHK59/15]
MDHSSNKDRGKQPQREKLDIEDDEVRVQRIRKTTHRICVVSSSNLHLEHLLERLNTFSNTTGVNTESLLNAGTGQLESRSGESLNELLARVKTFLPQLEASNAELEQKVAMNPRSVDIENVEGDERYIQMNLGLGVFEDRTGKEGPVSSSDEEGSEANAEGEDDDESEEDSNDDSDSCSNGSGTDDDFSTSEDGSGESASASDSGSVQLSKQGRQFAPLPKRAILSRPMKPLPRRARPEIVVLSETTTDGS